VIQIIVQLSKGRQITIPAEIRNQLELVKGSKLEIFKRNDEIILRPIGDDLDKMFSEAIKTKPKHNLTPKQMDELNERVFR